MESLVGHLSRRMLEHYSHIRMDAKRRAIEAFEKHAREQNWGTKWNCCEPALKTFRNGTQQVTFDTAWSPPYGIYLALYQRFPDITIKWFYRQPNERISGYLTVRESVLQLGYLASIPYMIEGSVTGIWDEADLERRKARWARDWVHPFSQVLRAE